MDFSPADLINGFCGAVATYLAFQMKTIIANHEARITALEGPKKKTPRRRRR